MSFKYLTVDNRDRTSRVFTTKWDFTVLALYKPGEHWWASPKITQGVPGLPVEWMWGSEIDCSWFLCCGTMWILRTHLKGFWQNGTESLCFVILLDGYSSYSGLVFPCSIHGDDIGFTPWVELNMKSFHYVLEPYLSWILCTYLLSILDLQNFTLHFTLWEVNTNKIHLMKILKYMNRDNSLQHRWLKHKHKATEYRFKVVAVPTCAFNIINLVLVWVLQYLLKFLHLRLQI